MIMRRDDTRVMTVYMQCAAIGIFSGYYFRDHVTRAKVKQYLPSTMLHYVLVLLLVHQCEKLHVNEYLHYMWYNF